MDKSTGFSTLRHPIKVRTKIPSPKTRAKFVEELVLEGVTRVVVETRFVSVDVVIDRQGLNMDYLFSIMIKSAASNRQYAAYYHCNEIGPSNNRAMIVKQVQSLSATAVKELKKYGIGAVVSNIYCA
ncbi:hypothetical protein HYY71_06110 [Candidatus Woesearchaeota archaeon]|nr:hypothetical protein [Candidatus Woesearchaeota archaeon]